jgi:hypothetical protein
VPGTGPDTANQGIDRAMTTWTRITDPDAALTLLPAWFATRMMAARGSYGFLLCSGEVVRVSRVTCVHVASSGPILLDVLLDRAGVPDWVDPSWRSRHFIGAPAVGATLATLNLAAVAMAIEFQAAEFVESANQSELMSEMAEMALEDRSPAVKAIAGPDGVAGV